jgi:hypothetical protein
MSEIGALCVCGHGALKHYVYVLNGHDQTRCRGCDPHANRSDMPTLYAMTSDSYEAAMDRAADHDFEERVGAGYGDA